MGRVPRHETKRRLRLMAKATVDMERGIYEWPDGRKPVKANGEAVVERKELLRVGGYSEHYRLSGSILFSDPYYQRQCAYLRARMDKMLPAVFDEDGIDPERILGLGLLMFTELEKRVQADIVRGPEDHEKVTTAQLLQHSPAFLKLGLELRARAEGREKPGAQHLHLDLGDTVVNMRPEERDRLAETQQAYASARMDQLRAVIDAVSGREEAGDDDVIDAEISPQSS